MDDICNHLKPQTLPQDAFPQQAATAQPFIKVGLVRQSGNIAVTAGQTVVADKELKTLLINDKHQMVMNVGTSLSIEPLLVNARLGCLVKLTNGEICTHVEHNGNPFIVQTNSGKAVITGTVFNIKADSQQMELVVTEGSVRFENENGNVEVKAGLRSTLTANFVIQKRLLHGQQVTTLILYWLKPVQKTIGILSYHLLKTRSF